MWLDSTLVSVLVKITPRRKYLTPKISVGALMGAQCQLAGTDNKFLSQGTLPHSRIAQNALSGDV